MTEFEDLGDGLVMETTLVEYKVNAAVDLESIPIGREHKPSVQDRPDPEWVRGTCPHCGELCVSNAWHIGGRGYVLKIHCWNALAYPPTCSYERTL